MNETQKEFLDYLQKEGKVKSWSELAEMFNFVSDEAARSFYRRNKRKMAFDSALNVLESNTSYLIDKESNTVKIESEKPFTSVTGVLEVLNLNENEWTVKEIWSKEKQVKDLTHPLNEDGVLRLYETTAKVLPKQTKEDPRDTFKEFVNEYKKAQNSGKQALKYYKDSRVTASKKNALILSLTDLHIDKKTYFEETGEYGEIDLIKSRAINACFDLVDRASSAHDINKIIIIGGNDFFHANTSANTTAKGTPLDVDGRWHKSFKEGLTLMTTIIDYCKVVAPVEYYTVLGNHSPEREWYLSVALEGFYNNQDDVFIETVNTSRKYFSFGRSAFMLTHEAGRKVNDLPLIFAVERPEMFANSKYRFVLTGHLHKKHETQFVGTDENYGIVFKILPSLCATDKWHYDNFYVNNQKSCMALVINEDYGDIAELIYNE